MNSKFKYDYFRVRGFFLKVVKLRLIFLQKVDLCICTSQEQQKEKK